MEFKLQVIEAAKKSSNREQARIHNIHESVIRRWRKDDTAARITQAVMTPDKLVKNRLPGTYILLITLLKMRNTCLFVKKISVTLTLLNVFTLIP